MKKLKDDPVADDVLDVIGHHRKHGAHKITAKITVAQGREWHSGLMIGFFHFHPVYVVWWKLAYRTQPVNSKGSP